MRHMVKENGKDVLLGGKAKAYVSDYKGQFTTEAGIFLKLLEEGCARYINEADDVLERKRKLVERMEDKHGISPKFSREMLDLLGFLLKEDTTKCMEQNGDEMFDKGEAAWDRGDYAEAVEWYQKAAEKGHAPAQTNLGVCYSKGKGIPKDMAKAVYWYTQAAEQGHASAQYNLGLFFERGIGVPQDKEKAVYWYKKAAKQGHAEAAKILSTVTDT